MNYYTDAFKKYADFNGRSMRVEYWMFALFNFMAVIGIVLVEVVLGTDGILYALYLLGAVIPSIALGTRRLHDTGRSGWWQLIGAVPIVGAVVLIIFFVTDSQPGANQYGPNPKGIGNAPVDITGELERLASLRERGMLTEEEFLTRKQALLRTSESSFR